MNRLKSSAFLVSMLCVSAVAGAPHASASSPPAALNPNALYPNALNPNQALAELQAGNRRYVTFKRIYPHQSRSRLLSVAKSQHPIAVILGCADSRVSPELAFDQGLGDLFTIRVAGNIADDAVIGSIEYAVDHLGVSLVVVLGHERCGAVAAAVQGGEAPGHIGALTGPIAPAVKIARGQKGDLLDNAVKANARQVAHQLRITGPLLANRVKSGRLKIVGARYDLDTGAITILP
jgi:carbonic anhydrase